MRYPSDTPICIVGAGAGGLSAAFYLRSIGYTHVTIFERNDQVGGKCHTAMWEGEPYEMGALEVTANYTLVLQLVEKYGLGMSEIGGMQLLDSVNGRVYPGSYLTNDFGPLQYLATFKDVLQFYFELWRSGSAIDEPGFLGFSREANRSMASWLDAKDMSAMSRLFALPVTCYGYGRLNQTSAAYVLKYLDRTNFSMLMIDMVRNACGLPGKWPKKLTVGYEGLMRCIAEDLTFAPQGDPNHTTTRIVTSAEISSITRDNPGDHPIKVQYTHAGIEESAAFDHLILASLLTEKALSFVDLTEKEREVLGEVRTIHYFTSLCAIPDLDQWGTYVMVVRDGAIVEAPEGSPCMVINQWTDTPYAVVYTWSTEPMTVEQVNDRLVAGMQTMAYECEVIKTTEWPYFPHFKPEDMRAGYAGLEDLMGRNRTYYAGGLMNFEDVERCFEWSKHLVDSYFATDPL